MTDARWRRSGRAASRPASSGCFGEILVGLDRSGQLRRLAAGSAPDARRQPGPDDGRPSRPDRPADAGGPRRRRRPGRPSRRARARRAADVADAAIGAGSTAPAGRRPARRRRSDATDPVERLLGADPRRAGRPTQRRLVEIEPGRWWLAERDDQEAAAPPLADRVEWAVFSLLSTAGPLSEAAFYERIATMFSGHDLPDETLVRACLESYRSPDSTPERLVTGDDLLTRSQEHAELLATIADGGHRLGMRVWLVAARAGAAGTAGGRSATCSTTASSGPTSAASRRAVDALAEVDAIWYIRGKVALLFEVEWTAMLGETLLRRHAASRPTSSSSASSSSRPERTELVRHKLERSPLLRAAIEDGGWHIIKWDHLRTFLAARPARPRRPRAAPGPGSGRRARRRADAAVRRLTGRRTARATLARPTARRHAARLAASDEPAPRRRPPT